MKKNLLLIFLIISIILYGIGIYYYSITESFILLLVTSILIAVAVNLFKSYNKKAKNEIKFEVDKVEIQKNKKENNEK
jgi:Mn2+/Fe2+ NRAMP family transporter